MKVTAPASGPTPVPDRAVMPRETAEGVKLQTHEEQRKQRQPLSKEAAEDLAEKMNAAAELFNKAVQFKVVEGTNRIIIKVVDMTTDEVLTEFPPERLLEALLAMERSLGILIDEKV